MGYTIFQGKIIHASIARSPRFNMNMYWAGLLITVLGSYSHWVSSSSQGKLGYCNLNFIPHYYLGVISVLIPFFIIGQPAMGSGFAASKTPQPWINRIKSLINHSIFGCGLFLTAKLLNFFNLGLNHEINCHYLS